MIWPGAASPTVVVVVVVPPSDVLRSVCSWSRHLLSQLGVLSEFRIARAKQGTGIASEKLVQ